jgi:hypothetical protein
VVETSVMVHAYTPSAGEVRRELREEDHKFKVSLVYITSSRLV